MPVEEQTEHNFGWGLNSTSYTRGGQRLTISDRQVTKLGFWLKKINSPTGDVTFTIRKVSDDSLICSKVWGQAEDLTTDPVYEEIEFDSPQVINEEVRILAEFLGGNTNDQVEIRLQLGDVKADECWTRYDGSWSDKDYDCAYIYTYNGAPVGWTGKVSGVTNPAKVMEVDVANIAKVHGVA